MFYAILLGGTHSRTALEVHQVVFVFAPSIEATYPLLRDAWFGDPDHVHIDGWIEAEGLDGYRIEPAAEAPSAEGPHLYFAHLGGYEDGIFGESHRHQLVVASDLAAAKQKAKQPFAHTWPRAHTDALIDVGEHLANGGFLRLVAGAHAEPRLVSGYRTFD